MLNVIFPNSLANYTLIPETLEIHDQKRTRADAIIKMHPPEEKGSRSDVMLHPN